MSFIAKSTIQELNNKMDAVAVVGDYVRLEQRGGRYIGLCPFHNEKTPSFSVDPELKLYYCFGCAKGGTVINFVMEMDKLSFPETVELLAKRFGVPIVYENTGGAVKNEEEDKQNDEYFELYSRMAKSFHHFLTEKDEGEPAKRYIMSRGISIAMIDRFRLGYAPADRYWLFNFLSRKGYSEKFLAGSRLFSDNHPKMAFFSDRLLFPIADRQGRTIAFGGRLLAGEGPKYLNSKDSDFFKKGLTLFAVDLALPEIRRTKEAYIVEGYMDVIALHQAGISNAVAPLGTAFTDEQAKLLRRWAERAYLFFDADQAGQNAAVKGILTCRRNALACAVVIPGGKTLPAGDKPPSEEPGTAKNPVDKPPEGEGGEAVLKDPADILRYYGPQALQKSAKCFINDFEYLIFRSRSLFDVSGSEGKARAVAFLFPYLEILDSEVSRDTCIGVIADSFGVDRGAVLHDFNQFDFNRRNRVRGEENSHGEFPQQSPPVRMNDELFLLTVVSVNQTVYPKFRTALQIKEIEDPAAKELFIALEECFINDEFGMDDLLSRISSEALRNFVIERGSSKEFSVNPDQLVSDGIKKVKQKRLEDQLAEIVIKLRTFNKSVPGAERKFSENTGIEELLAEKMHIDTELRRLKEDKQ